MYGHDDYEKSACVRLSTFPLPFSNFPHLSVPVSEGQAGLKVTSPAWEGRVRQETSEEDTSAGAAEEQVENESEPDPSDKVAKRNVVQPPKPAGWWW